MKRLLPFLLCALPLWCAGQPPVLFYNDNAIVTVQAGATLTIQGSLQNTAGGTIDNKGTIDLEGNLINAGTYTNTDPNTLKFSGTGNSDVTSGSAQFRTVQVNKGTGANVNLLSNMTVNTLLDFNGTNNRLNLGNFDLKLGSTATVTGYNSTEFIAHTGTGMVEKAVTANGTFEFPVGDGTNNYSPITAVYTGSSYTAANLRVRVNDLTHPNKPADATDYISRYWDVDATGIGGYSNTLTGTYIPGDLTGTASLVKGASYDGANWSYVGAAAGANTVTGVVTASAADFTGTNFFAKVDLIAFLQGAYNSGTGLMSTTFTTNPTIEALMLTSPYVDAPASVTDVPTDVTDWVKLVLKDPANPGTELGKASVFIKKDGHVVGLDGTSLPVIKNGLPTSIVGIVHRTHLSIRTPDAGINVATPTLYDFSLNLANAYDNPANTTNDAMFLASNGKYLMWAANGNSNTNVRFSGPANDRDYLLGTILGGNPAGVLSNVYSTGDYNMNGVVRFSGPANDRDFLLGTVLLGNTTNVWTQHY